MIKTNKKIGFSLAEALVSMLVLSVFFMATSKIITIKQPAEKIVMVHGFYECYDDGGLKEQTFMTTSSGVRNVTNCLYKPTKKLPNVLVYKIEPDGYYQSVETWVDMRVSISAETLSEEGENSYIYSLMNNSPPKVENLDLLKNQLSITYPASEVAKKLANGERFNALFVAW